MASHNGRILLALGAVGTILLAEGAGFGLAALLGVPFTDITLMLVFIAVGIGVDDVVVLVDGLARADPKLPPPERLAEVRLSGRWGGGVAERGGTRVSLSRWS